MGKIDRYLLSQLLMMFGFFALVLVAMFWLNQAVLLFDRLIADGQSALVFLEFTALALPKLIATVLPIAGFAAAVYVTNRLNSESELTVMLATGTSPFRLARPVLFFGLIVFCMASVLSHTLLPASLAELGKREAEIARNVTARLLTEGTFLNPTDGVTFYARSIGADGVLRDVFLSDRRDPAEGVIYTASEAYLVRANEGSTLIMVDGLAQRFTAPDGRLATANFADFSFDITALVNVEINLGISERNMTTWSYMRPWPELMELTGQSLGRLTEEFHSRFAEPLFCIVAALVGFCTLLVGGYSRFGVWREVVVAFGLLLLLDGIGGAVQDPVRQSPNLWPLLYLPVLLGTVLVTGLLYYATNPGLFRRRRPA